VLFKVGNVLCVNPVKVFTIFFLVGFGAIPTPFSYAPFCYAEDESAASGPRIKKIDIEGNKKIEKAAILSRIHSKVETSLSHSLVEDDIRSIFGLGYFENIEADEDEVPGGVRLIFVVKEKPIISKIVYSGNSALDEDEIKELVELNQYEVLDIHKLNLSVDKMTSKYEEKGYYLADVRDDIAINEKTNEAVVTFKIQENDKIQVKKINIIGSKKVPADDLKGVMQTKEGGPFSFITGSGSYREAVFDRDVQALGLYYGTQGYIRARFGRPEVTVSADKKYIYITFYVEEGDQYFVGNVDFSGDLLYTRDELRENLALVTGEVFNTETLHRETLRYTEKYGDLGYAFANVVPQPNIHDDTKKVDITFDVDKGERVFIGKISVTGNTKTKDKVIRRELTIYEGELFSGTRKRESRENVMRLGFFDNVEFHQSTSKVDPHVVDMEIKIKERATGQLVIGAGYASGGIGFTAQAQLSQNNFLGNGQNASLSAQVLTGQQMYDFNLGFQEPYLGYSLWGLGGDLYQIRRDVFSANNANITNASGINGYGVNTFQETKTGFDVKLSHPVLDYTSFVLTYKLESSSVNDQTIIDTTIFRPADLDGIASIIMASIVYDKRDDRFDPRNGWFWSVQSEFAGLGFTRRFIRNRATVKFFHPIIWDFIFRMNVTAANISGWGGRDAPINELFIEGGLYSLRGYDYLTIGPTRNLSTYPGNLSQDAINANLAGQPIVVGGHNEAYANMEVEFPILKEAKIRGVVFFDAGNVFNTFGENGVALLANIGWGIRWFTPIGPLRFEFGYPIVNSGPPKFYFTIGPPF
jgi:outer membrane protein insertion porin family